MPKPLGALLAVLFFDHAALSLKKTKMSEAENGAFTVAGLDDCSLQS